MDTQIGCIMILLAAAGALADSTYYINGIPERVESKDNYTTCTFTVNGKSSPTEVHNKQICNLLLRALQHHMPVSVEVTVITHVLSADEYSYAVSFHNRNAGWAGAKLESESFQYQLVGSVVDIYCSYNSHCYIAINTGYDIRNNNVYHFTSDQFACEKALNAFYLGARVTMIAAVDTNKIDRLIITKCLSLKLKAN